MPVPRPITIVGGGLAGLTLGVGLRRQEVPVTVWDAGRYPRHRVCGEFISGRGVAVLQRLELTALLERAGAIWARTARFLSPTAASTVRDLPTPAICLSREVLDALLAQAFRSLGGCLREGSRWPEGGFAEGVVRATGRRARPVDNGWRWFGLKIHAGGIALGADLEMHLSPSSYIGVNRIDHGQTNICGLFRARPGREPGEAGREQLRGNPGSRLRHLLAGACFDERSFCAVAGLPLRPQRAANNHEICVGDALTMIPPITGNGMSMAFESAEMATAPLVAYSRGELSWACAREEIARACDKAFGRRLAWARMLQWLLFSPLIRTTAGGALLRSELLWRLVFLNTR